MSLSDALGPELIALIRAEAAQAARAEVAAEVERILNTRALLTVAEFATRSGLSQHAVRHRIDRGQLQHVRNGGRILVPATELSRSARVRENVEGVTSSATHSEGPSGPQGGQDE